MEKYTEADFLELIQDEEFVAGVRESDRPIEFLEEMIKEHPGNKTSIYCAFEFVRINLSDKREMDSSDYNEILDNILKQSKFNKDSSPKKFYLSWLRKAAVILVFIAIGSYGFFEFTKNSYEEFAEKRVHENDQAIIMLSDGSKQVLDNSDSFIEYSPNQEEVIIHNENEEKKIKNECNHKNSSLNQVLVPYGQRRTIRLSDGTIVQLNSGSQLVFPATFTGRKREVYLKGEGFFEVRKDEKAPFIVKTNYVDIKVLGTTFAVSAYSDENCMSTVLVKGKVNVVQKNSIVANEEFELIPGQGCFYSADKQQSVVKKVDVNDYISWTEGLFQFKDMALLDVVRRIRKYYNTSIQIEGEQLAKTLVSGKLVLSDDINEVMQYLSKTMEGRYSKTENDIYILKQ